MNARGATRAKVAVTVLLVTALLSGCRSSPSAPGADPFSYTCAQLAIDFSSPHNAPADRGQAAIDALVSKLAQSDQASVNVRDEVVYQLTRSCARRDPSFRPARAALRAVQRLYRRS